MSAKGRWVDVGYFYIHIYMYLTFSFASSIISKR